jgi:hypothetical protein
MGQERKEAEAVLIAIHGRFAQLRTSSVGWGPLFHSKKEAHAQF